MSGDLEQVVFLTVTVLPIVTAFTFVVEFVLVFFLAIIIPPKEFEKRLDLLARKLELPFIDFWFFVSFYVFLLFKKRIRKNTAGLKM